MSHDANGAELCQSCGKPISPEVENCPECGAPVGSKIMEKQLRVAMENLINSLPDVAREKVIALQKQIEKKPESVAAFIQLSNLFKDLGFKDLAIDYMEKAAALDPENKFLQQKVRLLIDGGSPDVQKLAALEKSDRETRNWAKGAIIGAGVLLLFIFAIFAFRWVFPTTWVLAKAPGEYDAVSPGFNTDGSRIAYLTMPKFTLFGIVDSFSGNEKGKTTLMVKPLKGDPKEVLTLGKGSRWGFDYKWRPRHDQITFIASDFMEKEPAEPGENFQGPQIINVSAGDGNKQTIAKGEDFAWSYNGQYLAYVRNDWYTGREGGLYILDMDTDENSRISSLNCSAPNWAPAEYAFVFQARDRQKVQDMYETLFQKGDTATEEDYEQISSYVGDIYLYDMAGEGLIQITDTGNYRNPTFTPDGKKIVALSYADKTNPANRLEIMNVDGTGREVLLTPCEKYEWFGAFAFSMDGKTLAFEGYFVNADMPSMPAKKTPLGMIGGGENYVSDIFLVNSDGSNLHRLTGRKHKFKSNPTFSPNGDILAYEVMYVDMRREIWGMKLD